MKVNNDIYLNMDKSLVDPNELYDVLDSMLDALEEHLELLQSIIDKRVDRRFLSDVLDKVYDAHDIYYYIEDDLPLKNRFRENHNEKA